MQLIKKLIRSRICQIGALVGTVLMGVLLYLKFTHRLSPYLSPGPVSAASDGEPIEGFHSHSEFELECLHCHEPVHCLSANRCRTCHHDIAEQQANAEGVHGLLPGTDRCHTCHREHKGREAELTHVPFLNIDHLTLTGFSLDHHKVDYAGEPLTCESCHKEERFEAVDMDCLACHTQGDAAFIDKHGARFGGECMLCHDGVDRMRKFNHNAVFVREGEHANLDCEDCHIDRIFAGMSHDCASCHEEPGVHAGHFGTDCARCHVSAGWHPAQLTQHTFSLEHGEEGQLVCETCHVDSYTVYTCAHCHEDPAMQLAHADETIFAGSEGVELEQCSACHPTGQPDEGRVSVEEDPNG